MRLKIILTSPPTQRPKDSSSASPSDLYDLTCPLLITPQHRPAHTISLHKRQFDLSSHNLEGRLFCVDLTEKGQLCLISLHVYRGQIQRYRRRRSEPDTRSCFIHLLQIQAGHDRCVGLVKIMPVAYISHLDRIHVVGSPQSKLTSRRATPPPAPLSCHSPRTDASSSVCSPRSS